MALARSIIFSAAGAAAGTMVALALCARAERTPLRVPHVATGGWLPRRAATPRTRLAAGLATNAAAASLWGGAFGAWTHLARPRAAGLLRDGAALGGIAGLIDYGLLPRRLSPRWQEALTGRAVVLGMAGMAAGASAGALVLRATDAALDRDNREKG